MPMLSRYGQAFSARALAHLALAAAAILARPSALILRRFPAGLVSDSAPLTFAHLAFKAATFFAFPAALNLYFFRVLTGCDTGTEG